MGNLWAAEMKKQSSASDLSNIGFMKNPPRSLTEQFPMCDAFLKVKWIDKKKMIGYTHYEAYVYNIPHSKWSKKKKQVWALVRLGEDWNSYSLDVYPYVHRGQLNELFDLVKNGKEVKDAAIFEIKYKGNIAGFYGLVTALTGYKKTVCVAYPDEQRAWIVEARSVGRTYDKAQQNLLFNRIKETWPSFRHHLLNDLWILDVNFDGKSDFIRGFGIVEYTHKRVSRILCKRGFSSFWTSVLQTG